MMVMGLDVSETRMGWAFIEAETGESMACGVYSISTSCPGNDLRRILSGWMNYPPSWTLAAIYIEGAHVGLNRNGSIRHAYVIGRALQQAERSFPDSAVQLIQPSDWKKTIGLKGNASKEDVAAWAVITGWGKVMGNPPKDPQDAYDAAGIATAGRIRNAEIVAAAR